MSISKINRPLEITLNAPACASGIAASCPGAHYWLRHRGRQLKGKGQNRVRRDLLLISDGRRGFDLPPHDAVDYFAFLIRQSPDEYLAASLVKSVKGIPFVQQDDDQVRDLLYGDHDDNAQSFRYGFDVRDTVDRRDLCIEENAVRQLEAEAKSIGVELSDLGKKGDPTNESKNLISRLGEIHAMLECNTYKDDAGRRHPKELGACDQTKAANLLSHLFSRFLNDVIRPNSEELFRHLQNKEVFRIGSINYYRPPAGVIWTIIDGENRSGTICSRNSIIVPSSMTVGGDGDAVSSFFLPGSAENRI